MSRIDETLPFHPVRIAVLTVSDTRTPETDKSGDTLVARLTEAGHILADRGIVPGLGSQLAVVRACVSVDPQIAGKPFRPLLDETVLRIGAEHPIFVGDRTDTDILCANIVGMDSLFVFTGAHGKHDLAAAAPDYRPTYIGYDAAALLEPPREAEFHGQRYVCGYQEVDLAEGAAYLSTRPDTRDEQLDALWAALQAAWRFDVDISAVLNSLDMLR